MKNVLKLVCLITCLWWCWLKASDIATCYSLSRDVGYCVNRF